MMFCFMKHKNEMSYDKIFEWIKSYQEDILNNEKSIILDFELASFNSIKKRFIHLNLCGCCFHLGQIIWRKIQNLGFSSIVINNASIKLQVKMILALSFVSFEDVVFYSLRLNLIFKRKNLKKFYNFLNGLIKNTYIIKVETSLFVFGMSNLEPKKKYLERLTLLRVIIDI
ncbi:hypothetical protein DMUE_3274 [Dictyocoela muelleri]|nr:hypothetical protein DMUE_3274 [Dictyocoela muelleri]